MSKKVKKIAFAASSGGHYEQIMMLRPLMDKYNGFVVTEKTSYTSNDKGVRTHYVKQVNRKEVLFIPKMILILFKSIYIYIKERPDVVISTGVLAMIPFCLIVKLCGGKLIYIESFAKISSSNMTGRFLYKYADRFYVQWEEMLKLYPDAVCKGGIY